MVYLGAFDFFFFWLNKSINWMKGGGLKEERVDSGGMDETWNTS